MSNSPAPASARRLLTAVLTTATLLGLASIVLATAALTYEPSKKENGGKGNPLKPASLTSRNGTPLQESEVFGGNNFTSRGREYQILAKDTRTNCAEAGDGTGLSQALAQHDCTQVIRATVKSADGLWALTIGVADLADSAGATAVDESITDARQARFTIMNPSGIDLNDGRRIFVQHRTEGHYVLYGAIASLGNSPVDGSTPGLTQALDDGEAYLDEALRLHALGRG
ncbi:MAG: hypothetical protein HOQ05_00970 [Corynebacteriales bacterium]|nr:hypothetical protein [Mycobacteriales bacterium]